MSTRLLQFLMKALAELRTKLHIVHIKETHVLPARFSRVHVGGLLFGWRVTLALGRGGPGCKGSDLDVIGSWSCGFGALLGVGRARFSAGASTSRGTACQTTSALLVGQCRQHPAYTAWNTTRL